MEINIKLLKLLLEDKRTDLNVKNNKGESFVDLMLDNIKKIGFEKSESYFKILENYYDRLNNASKQTIKNNRIANLILETGYRNNPSAVLGVLIHPVVPVMDENKKFL